MNRNFLIRFTHDPLRRLVLRQSITLFIDNVCTYLRYKYHLYKKITALVSMFFYMRRIKSFICVPFARQGSKSCYFRKDYRKILRLECQVLRQTIILWYGMQLYLGKTIWFLLNLLFDNIYVLLLHLKERFLCPISSTSHKFSRTLARRHLWESGFFASVFFFLQ